MYQMKDTAALFTVLTGLPLIQVGRMVAYGVGVSTGEIESGSPLDTVRGVLTGEVRSGQRR